MIRRTGIYRIKKKETYECEYCGKEFEDENSCLYHELSCEADIISR